MSVTTRLLALGVGCLLLFVGVALVAPRLVRPLASVLGWPAAKVGGAAGSLARENSMRNPGRTASTAAALMIGLALVTFVGVLGFGLRKSFEDAVDKLFVADYAITADAVFAPVAPDAGEAASGAASVELVSGIRQGAGRSGGGDVFVTGVDEHMSEVVDLDWKAGSDALPARLGKTNAFVRDEFADDKDLSIGSTLELETPSAKLLTLKVIGIFDEPEGGSPFGDVTISTKTFDASFPQPTNLMTFVNTAGGVSADNTAQLERALTAFPDVKVLTADEFKQEALAPLDRLLNVLYVLLALSVIVSAFGIVNTLVLTVFERTRELGMLRAVGMTRRQVRRMIRHESIVTSLIGAVLGIAIGIFLAFLITQALAEEGFVFAIPYSSLVVFMLAAIVVGLIAAILPARRAARLNVLQALQYE
jgi:putative ABC transport system permease protein